jgi:hypothetical protein
MKQRKYILFGILLSIAINTFPQRFDGGVMGGLTASQIDGDFYSGFNKLGITFGAFANTRFSQDWGAQLEIGYKAKGASHVGPFTSPYIYQVSLRYAVIPLTLNYYAADEFFFDLGVSIGYLIDVNYYDNGGTVPDDKINPKFNNYDINWILGANYRLSDLWTISLRYSYSFTPIRVRNTGVYRGALHDMLGLKDGDYNNYLTFSFYYQLESD